MLPKSLVLALGLILAAPLAHAADAPFAKQEAAAGQLREAALKGSGAYDILESLTTEIGARPAGSPALLRAADWGAARMKALGYDTVTVESFKVPGWKRGAETAEVTAPFPQKLVITALGGSVATPAAGLSAQVVLFKRYDDLLAQAPGSLTGKIVVVIG